MKIQVVLQVLKKNLGITKWTLFECLQLVRDYFYLLIPKQKPSTRAVLCIGLCFSIFKFGFSQNKPTHNHDLEIGKKIAIKYITENDRDIRQWDGVTVGIYQISETVSGKSPEEKARNYIKSNMKQFDLEGSFEDIFEHHASRTSNSGTVVRYRQKYKGLRVDKNEITIKINNAGEIVQVLNSTIPIKEPIAALPKKSDEEAYQVARNHLGITKAEIALKKELMIHFEEFKPYLVYRIMMYTDEKPGEWVAYVDANSNEIISFKNNASHVNGTGLVFDPCPLTTSGSSYGNGGFVDDNDANNLNLQDELQGVLLLDISQSGGDFVLSGPWAQIVDDEAPNNGLFSQSSSNFSCNRENDRFEAVMCYYHVDHSMRYINNTLGIAVSPTQYSGGVQIDPHGLNGQDQSHYVPGTGLVAMGEGGVDDAEDADVIIHELAHGIHDWITSNSSSSLEGLGEGTGDYWGQSYSWSQGDNSHVFFTWDGNNEFWPGRVTNYTAAYPSGLTGSIHTDGQIWSSTLMLIFQDIGRTKTDRIFWEGLSMTNSSTTQRQAAESVYQAAIDLNYSQDDLCIIYHHLNNKYNISGTLPCCYDFETPLLSSSSISNTCPTFGIDLNSLLLNQPACAEVVWSTDGDPSNGISPSLNPIVTTSGEYFVYFYYDVADVYSPAATSVMVEIENCCNVQGSIVIDSHVTYSLPTAVGGNIHIVNGGKLTVTSTLQLSQYQEITVGEGGKLILQGQDALLTVCPGVSLWQGVSVYSGGEMKVNKGKLNYALYGVRAYDGSALNFKDLVLWGPSASAGNGITLSGIVNLINAENTAIFNYQDGIRAQNSNSYYNFEGGYIGYVMNGIRLINAPSRITGFNINSWADGVRIHTSPGSIVENNKINPSQNTNIPAVTHGIYVSYSPSVYIKENIIGTDLKPALEGIHVVSSNSCWITNENKITCSIRGIYAAFSDINIDGNDINCKYYSQGGIFIYSGTENEILNNYIDAIGSHYGIQTVSCHDSEILNNDILGVVVTGKIRTAAILSKSCSGQRISYNVISGVGNTTGMLAQNTTGNTYECNEVNNGDEGLGIYFNSQGHDIRGNKFNTFTDLAIRSEIGWQVHEGNEFIGGKADASALASVAGSQFFVNPNITNHMPSNPNPSSGWFIPEPDEFDFYTCSGSPGPDWIPFWEQEQVLCDHYHKVLNQFGYGSPEYSRMMIAMKRHDQFDSDYFIYECIGDPVPPECIKLLVGVEKGVNSHFGQKENAVAKQLLEKVVFLSKAFESQSGNDYLPSMAEDTKSANEKFKARYEKFKNELGNYYNELQNVICQDLITGVSKEILLEQIKFLEAENNETFDYSKVIEYSKLCSDEYGPYVHLARNIASFASNEYFDNYDGCGQAYSGQNKVTLADLSVAVFPNPSTGMVNLNFDKSINGVLTVSNIEGKIIQERKLEDSDGISVDLSDYQGLFFMKVMQDNGVYNVHKVMIIE